MSNNRIPNHRIDSLVADLEPFTNYNQTIRGYQAESRAIGAPLDTARAIYAVIHHRTQILAFDLETQTITHLADWYISQTTSRLVGRILRSLPRESVIRYLDSMTNKHDQARLARMVY